MVDPNWLLATCAQASASIIAIIGGFFVNRIMILYSEKNEIASEINDIQNKLKFKSHTLDDLDKKKLIMDQEMFYEKCETDVIEKVITEFQHEADLDVSKLENYFDEYYIKYNEHGMEYENLKPYFDDKIRIIKNAVLFFQSKCKEFNYTNENLDKFIIENNIKNTERDIYRNVFKAMAKRNKRVQNRVFSNMLYINHVNTKIDKLKVIPKLQRYEKLVYTKESLELEIKLLNQQKEQFEMKINYFQKPKGLVWAVLIFIYFSIVGIVFPVLLMPMSEDKFTYKIKYLVIGLFISGLILVFTYLILSIKSITKKVD